MAGTILASRPAVSGGRRRLPSPVRIRRARIEIVPLIDVMFFLLASFMMVSLSMERSRAVRVDLPTAPSAADDFAADALNVAVERDGTVSVGSLRMDPARLDAELGRHRAAHGSDPMVLVTADRAATHGAIAAVLDRIRRAGFQRIAFVTAAPSEGSPKAEQTPERP